MSDVKEPVTDARTTTAPMAKSDSPPLVDEKVDREHGHDEHTHERIHQHDLDKALEGHGIVAVEGRLVIDPKEAEKEFGVEVASRLKLSKDGTKVLWPQPTDSDEDPQNWSDFRKNLILVIITMAAFVPDFDSGIGIASLFPLAAQFKTTPTVINNQTSNWSIFLLGWGGLFAIILTRCWGRLPVLFWSQLIGLAFLIGCAVSPDLTTFTVMRCLTAFFSTAPQITGLYVISDMFPFHLQARKTSIWGFGYLVSPFISPWLLGYLVSRATWRWAYGIGCIYSGIVITMIVFFMHETMYHRRLDPIPARPTQGLRYRIETLLGITGIRQYKYADSVMTGVKKLLMVVWRPNVLPVLFYVGLTFGFSIGINVTTAQFVGEPRIAGGFGFREDYIATIYLTPIIGVLLGEVIGRYFTDWSTDMLTRRNSGVFVAEMRLWALYVGMPLMVLGFNMYGYALSRKSYVALLVIGWGLYEIGIMITVIAVLNYLRDCYGGHVGEISAWVNLARVLGGFAVPYWQFPYAVEHGALKESGWESAIIAGLFLLIIPALQIKGAALRQRFSIRDTELF